MNQTDYDNLGSKIKELRIKMNLTQSEVAAALNVTPGYISNVENNRSAMSLRILTYFAKLTGLSLDALVGLIDSDYQPNALEHEFTELAQKLDTEQQQKLIKTLKLWLE